ncbi:hypothetical protein [Mucispirillum schaedleri]|jgi:hypothetical protein|uniref:Uncharacterized protein n=1 Tax=Mucispirillum schaedleri ASF457 TaxID=1379858 RepID=V2QFD9_9BACT|nr:hypothetical protein [Mucispirillum schaedleri]MCX4360150.1 hypothetical protein [Mucispirillum schaedleri]USF24679.1 hypothetical protein N508_001768 [Mucispirillum schaedleri ASF457]SIW07819.1 conserved hypothetical protein [Mucispirillum schaedleri ASF457]
MYIEINLSIEKSGGEENLPKVINAVSEAVKEKFPEAEVIVRKGFFKTIDGVYSDDLYAEGEVRQLINTVRERVLN